jgi:hypothetical protein
MSPPPPINSFLAAHLRCYKIESSPLFQSVKDTAYTVTPTKKKYHDQKSLRTRPPHLARKPVAAHLNLPRYTRSNDIFSLSQRAVKTSRTPTKFHSRKGLQNRPTPTPKYARKALAVPASTRCCPSPTAPRSLDPTQVWKDSGWIIGRSGPRYILSN